MIAVEIAAIILLGLALSRAWQQLSRARKTIDEMPLPDEHDTGSTTASTPYDYEIRVVWHEIDDRKRNRDRS